MEPHKRVDFAWFVIGVGLYEAQGVIENPAISRDQVPPNKFVEVRSEHDLGPAALVLPR
jgi:hypothetical protein